MANRKSSEAMLGKNGGDIKPTLSAEKRAVCCIETNKSCGTGFYVEVQGTKYIATCYHVIHNVEEAKEAVFRFFYVSLGTKDSCNVKFDKVTSDDFFTGGQKQTENDYTFIRCRGSFVKKLEEEWTIFPIPTSTKIPHNLKNMHVKVVQHPGGKPLSESEQMIENVKDKIVTYHADTLEGSSGSPVFLKDSMKLLALHFQGDKTGNDGILISSIISKLPLTNESTHVVMLRCSVPKTGNSELVLANSFSNSLILQDTDALGNQIHAGDVGQLSYQNEDDDVHYANAGRFDGISSEVPRLPQEVSPKSSPQTLTGLTISVLSQSDISNFHDLLQKDVKGRHHYEKLLKYLGNSNDENLKIDDTKMIIESLSDPGRFTVGNALLENVGIKLGSINLKYIVDKLEKDNVRKDISSAIKQYGKKNNKTTEEILAISIDDLLLKSEYEALLWKMSMLITMNSGGISWRMALENLVITADQKSDYENYKRQKRLCDANQNDLQAKYDSASRNPETLRCLFLILRVKKPDMNLGSLSAVLDVLGLRSVKMVIDEIIKKYEK